MASEYNWSVVLLLGESPIKAAIEGLRRDISRRTGSLAAMELPLHVTLMKFDDLPRKMLSRTLDDSRALLPKNVELTGPKLEFEYGAIWYDVEEGSLARLRARLQRQMQLFPTIRHETQHAHVTLAYEDIAPERLTQEAERAASLLRLERVPVPVRSVVIARQSIDGVWSVDDSLS